jgi:hypothetical protein
MEESFFGSAEKAREGWDRLRRKVVGAGLGRPYLVAHVRSVELGAAMLDEFARHLWDAIEWTRRNRASAESNLICICAWNETGDGGRLVSNLLEGAARLEPMRRVLGKQGS